VIGRKVKFKLNLNQTGFRLASSLYGIDNIVLPYDQVILVPVVMVGILIPSISAGIEPGGVRREGGARDADASRAPGMFFLFNQ
jgi:hypothetical protein